VEPSSVSVNGDLPFKIIGVPMQGVGGHGGSEDK
jgi:hypothetical protein